MAWKLWFRKCLREPKLWCALGTNSSQSPLSILNCKMRNVFHKWHFFCTGSYIWSLFDHYYDTLPLSSTLLKRHQWIYSRYSVQVKVSDCELLQKNSLYGYLLHTHKHTHTLDCKKPTTIGVNFNYQCVCVRSVTKNNYLQSFGRKIAQQMQLFFSSKKLSPQDLAGKRPA